MFSILWPDSSVTNFSDENISPAEPDFFQDLNLDQLVERLTSPKKFSQIRTLFHSIPRKIEVTAYRQEIFRELQEEKTLELIVKFTHLMDTVHDRLGISSKLRHPLQKARWHLDAACSYIEATVNLTNCLNELDINSDGLKQFREYLRGYCSSASFMALRKEALTLLDMLSRIRYRLEIENCRVTVLEHDGEGDLTVETEASFSRFKKGNVKNYLIEYEENLEMNHVESKILDILAGVCYRDVFDRLQNFYKVHHLFMDETIRRFDLEIRFYISFLELIRSLEKKGLAFCFPLLSPEKTSLCCRDGFDIVLAMNDKSDGCSIVTNGFELSDPERVMVVTGPNQGGKTTFARMLGQLHYLAAIGCPVPGKEARLLFFDQIFTHFDREESRSELRGKLMDDLIRIRCILDASTERSLIILNEPFSATSLKDALFLGKRILEKIIERGSLCVCVTFLDELTLISEKVVSMVSMVDPYDPAIRTFRIVRRAADGLAYALSIAMKHRLTREELKERIRKNLNHECASDV